MKAKFFILIFSTTFNLFASNDIKAYAIAIFDKDGNGENIQHKRKSTYNYNGFGYSKVVVLSTKSNITPNVNIGSSKGHFLKREAVYNSKKRVIAYEITYKHYNIKNGYFEVYINNKLQDSKVFIK